MTAILDRILATKRASEATAREEYRSILRRAVGNVASDGDADRLAACMATLGTDAPQVEKDLEVITECQRLEAVLVGDSEGERLQREVAEAAAAFGAFSKETEKIENERRAQAGKLNMAITTAQSRLRIWNDDAGKLIDLRRRHFVLLGLDPPTPPATADMEAIKAANLRLIQHANPHGDPFQR